MFASQIFVPSGNIQGIVFAPTLHIRWRNDGSGLTPIPQDRPSSPATLAGNGDFNFSLDDSGTDPTGRELAVSVRDAAAPQTDGQLFRSGILSALPASFPANPNGVLTLVVPDAVPTTIADANASIATKFASGPMSTSNPNVKVTGVTLITNPNNSATWLMTAFGTYTGGTPVPGLETLFYRYSAEVSFKPNQDSFDAGRIVITVLGAPSVVFSDAPSGGQLVTMVDTFVASFLNLMAPIIAVLVEPVVASSIDALIDQQIKDQASLALGIPKNSDGTPGPLPPNVTVSALWLTISGTTLTVMGVAGTFGSIVAPQSTSGCSTLTTSALVLMTLVALLVWWIR